MNSKTGKKSGNILEQRPRVNNSSTVLTKVNPIIKQKYKNQALTLNKQITNYNSEKNKIFSKNQRSLEPFAKTLTPKGYDKKYLTETKSGLKKSTLFFQNDKSIQNESTCDNFIDIISKMILVLDTAKDNPIFTYSKHNINLEEKELNGYINNAILFFEIDNIKQETFELYNNLKLYNNSNYSQETFKSSSSEIKKNKNLIKLSSERRISIYNKFFEVCTKSLNDITQLLKEDIHKNNKLIHMSVNVNVKNINNISNLQYDVTNHNDLKKLLSKSRVREDSLDFNTGDSENIKVKIPSSNIKYVQKPKEQNLNFRNLNSMKNVRSKSLLVKGNNMIEKEKIKNIERIIDNSILYISDSEESIMYDYDKEIEYEDIGEENKIISDIKNVQSQRIKYI